MAAAGRAGGPGTAGRPAQEAFARLASANVVIHANGQAPVYRWVESEVEALAWLAAS